MGKIGPDHNKKELSSEFLERSQELKDELYLQARLLAEIVKRILENRANIRLSEPPSLEKHPIVEFRKRMRITSMDKFPIESYISVVNFYLSEKDIKEQRSIGAIVLCVREDEVGRILKKMEYPLMDDDDPVALEDAVGTLCNLISGNFKAGLTQWGYKDLAMSSFRSYKNDVFDGVDFDIRQKEKYVVSFKVREMKLIEVELTMGKIPKV